MKPLPTIAAFGLFGLPLHALQINLTYAIDGQLNSIPANDADGARLMLLANAAAAYWEDIIEDNLTVAIKIRYDNGIPVGTIGFMNQGTEGGGRPLSATIGIRGTTTWYYDANPEDNDEFQMSQRLYRNALNGDLPNFTGSVPGVIEIGFSGAPVPGAPVAVTNGTDLYTVILHEIGHSLGMVSSLSTAATEVLDGDYDVNPSLVNGNNFAVIDVVGNSGHIPVLQAVMNPAIPIARRRLPCAADVLALATCPSPGYTLIDLPRQDFCPGGTLDWNTSSNWVGNQVPGSSDEISCRHGVDIPGDPIIGLSATGACKTLLLTNETRLQTSNHKLDVALTATLEYDGILPAPEIFVESGGELEATDAVVNGGEIDLSGGLVDLADDLLLSEDTLGRKGILSGYGTVDVVGRLVNDGRIDATDASTLLFQSVSPTPWDIDGVGGAGEVLAIQGNLNFASGAVTDAFDGFMQIEGLRTITIGQGWSLGSGGVLQINGGGGNTATLAGGQFTATAGDIQASGNARISAPVEFGGTLETIVAASGQLVLDGTASVDAGAYLIGANANLEFNNTTTITGGTLIIADTGNVRLDGSHTLEGGVFTGLGTLRFNGSQTTIAQAVTIDCGKLDFDGGGGLAKVVNVNADLTINSDQVDLTNNSFESTLNINGFSNLLEVNGPAEWTMGGALNIDSGSNLYFPSIDGAPFTMSGTTTVDDSTRWDARVTLTGSVSLPAAADRLALGGGDLANPNRIEGGSVSGAGTLRALNARLTGFGAVSTLLDFSTGSALLAEDGLLTFSGNFLTVPPLIGTSDNTGILDVSNPWQLPSTSVLDLNGGTVKGGNLTNAGAIQGHGELRSNTLTNNGTLAATDGQSLIIDTTLAPDLDGTGTQVEIATHQINAVQGNLKVVLAPSNSIGASVTVGPGCSLDFQAGWTLAASGTLTMTGDTPANPAVLAGGTSTLNGTTAIDDHTRATSAVGFQAGSTTTFADAGSRFQLEAASTIAAGAVLSGPGTLSITSGATLTLDDAALVGVNLANEGGVVTLGASPGQASVASYNQAPASVLSIEILGTPASGDYDQLQVSGQATLAGRLEVVFNTPPQAGDTWEVISAGGISGGFSEFTVVGLPPGYQLVKHETGDSVFLTVSADLTFAAWATAEGLLPGSNGIGDDPDGDQINNALEMFLATDPENPDFGLLSAPQICTTIDGDFLSITLTVSHKYSPSDLSLTCTRSVDLTAWSAANVVLESSVFDPVLGVEQRVYRSKIPFGTLGAEFLRIEIVQTVPVVP